MVPGLFPYSCNGLTSETSSSHIVCFSLNVYDLLIIFRILLALIAKYWTWSLNVKQLSTFTSKSLTMAVLLTLQHFIW